MADDQVVQAISAFVVLVGSHAIELLQTKKRSIRKRKRWYIRSFLAKRRLEGAYRSLMNDLRLQSGFENFVRMSSSEFEELLHLVAPLIIKNGRCRKDNVSPGEQLAVTLRFLATGDSYGSLMYQHRISKPKLCQIIPNVCTAIVQVLREEIKIPRNEEEWRNVAKKFESRWNYPNCIGALDGKHILIQAPNNTGSLYFNYKHNFSIVLMALCDSNYNFLYCDVGVQGRIADGGVFASTDFSRALHSKKLNLPRASCLPSRAVHVPFVIVADDAFALSENVMKPFPGKHFKGSVERAYNYRHSRARRIIENTFGILSAVFRVLRRPMLLAPEKATQVVLSCIYLHNFLRNRKSRDIYSPPSAFDREDNNGNLIPGEWRRDNIELGGLRNCARNNRNIDGVTVRNEFAQYFYSCPLTWQHKCA